MRAYESQDSQEQEPIPPLPIKETRQDLYTDLLPSTTVCVLQLEMDAQSQWSISWSFSHDSFSIGCS
jgi:hypothetical protein